MAGVASATLVEQWASAVILGMQVAAGFYVGLNWRRARKHLGRALAVGAVGAVLLVPQEITFLLALDRESNPVSSWRSVRTWIEFATGVVYPGGVFLAALSTAAACCAVMLSSRRATGRRRLFSSFRSVLPCATVGVLTGAGLGLLVNIGTRVWPFLASREFQEWTEAYSRTSQVSPSIWNAAIGLGGIGAAVCEESVFRGFIQSAVSGSFRGSTGRWVGIAFAALLWAVPHGWVAQDWSGRVLSVALTGVPLGWLAAKSGLEAAIVAHAVLNLCVWVAFPSS